MALIKKFGDFSFSHEIRWIREISTLSDWLKIWYFGYIVYPDNDGGNEIFCVSEISTVRKKTAELQLSPIGLKFCI